MESPANAASIPPFRLIVGLGNPGREYEKTRHNVGFMVLDRLASRYGIKFCFESKWLAELALSEGILFCKPLSFMNRSGEPVAGIGRYYKVAPNEVLVVYDDIALPLGKLRLRTSGSAGGHNGLQSILNHYGTLEVPRLRLGIGESGEKELSGHVLSNFKPAELPVLEESLDRAVAAIEFAQKNGAEAAMNSYN